MYKFVMLNSLSAIVQVRDFSAVQLLCIIKSMFFIFNVYFNNTFSRIYIIYTQKYIS